MRVVFVNALFQPGILYFQGKIIDQFPQTIVILETQLILRDLSKLTMQSLYHIRCVDDLAYFRWIGKVS